MNTERKGVDVLAVMADACNDLWHKHDDAEASEAMRLAHTGVAALIAASVELQRWLVRPKRRTNQNWMNTLDARRSAANEAFEAALAAVQPTPKDSA